MSSLALIVWVLNLLSDTIGQLSFKAAAVHAGESEGVQRWLLMARNYWLWIGLAAYVAEILLWLAFLSLVPLSLAVLLGSLNIMCVMLGGKIFFKEKITRRRAIAVSLIAAGVTLVGWSA